LANLQPTAGFGFVSARTGTGTADMRRAGGRLQVQVAWRVMRADVDVAPSSTESPHHPPTPMAIHPLLSLIRTRDVNLLASDGIGRPLSNP